MSTFGGNDGYRDAPKSYYIYDSTVKHYEKLKKSDYVIVTDAKKIIGFSTISEITYKKTSKPSYRCPTCKIKEFYLRSTVKPKYKCRNKHEFDTPKKENIAITRFTAFYNDNFIAPLTDISVKELLPYFINYNRYYSIQSANISYLSGQHVSIFQALSGMARKPSHRDYLIEDFNNPPYEPSGKDHRKFRQGRIPDRSGQEIFKNKLIRAYGSKCMLTGCDIPYILEASHICPYLGQKDHHPANGLLLRKDLHTLFDKNKLGIHPDTKVVHPHPSIASSWYAQYQGKKLVTGTKNTPSKKALRIRWKIFKEGKNAYLP